MSKEEIKQLKQAVLAQLHNEFERDKLASHARQFYKDNKTDYVTAWVEGIFAFILSDAVQQKMEQGND